MDLSVTLKGQSHDLKLKNPVLTASGTFGYGVEFASYGDLAALGGLVRERVREVALFGASREHFEKAWRDLAPLRWHPTLEEAVRALAASAKEGDVVLLAPATSSFDLYDNYMARGDDFKRIVSELA